MTHITDQIETYLAGGLSPAERDVFELHITECQACAAALADARAADAAMEALFAAARPSADFEDRMIQAMSLPHPWLSRPIIHPMVRRAAVGIAASLMIAGIGYVVNSGMNGGTLPGWTFLDGRTGTGTGIVSAARSGRVIHGAATRDLVAGAKNLIDRNGAMRGMNTSTGGELDVDQGTQGWITAEGKSVSSDIRRREAFTTRNPTAGGGSADVTKGPPGTWNMRADSLDSHLLPTDDGKVAGDHSWLASRYTGADQSAAPKTGADKLGRLTDDTLAWAATDGGAVYTPGSKGKDNDAKGSAARISLNTADSLDSHLLGAATRVPGSIGKSAVQLQTFADVSNGDRASAEKKLAESPASGKPAGNPRESGSFSGYYASAQNPPGAPGADKGEKDLPPDGRPQANTANSSSASLASSENLALGLQGGISSPPAPKSDSAPIAGPVVPAEPQVKVPTGGTLALGGQTAGEKLQKEAGVAANMGLSTQIKKTSEQWGSMPSRSKSPAAQAPADAKGAPIDKLQEAIVEKDQAFAQAKEGNTDASAALIVAQADITGRQDGDHSNAPTDANKLAGKQEPIKKAGAELKETLEDRRSAALERRHTVADLQRTADDLTKQGRTREAEGVVAQIKQLGPDGKPTGIVEKEIEQKQFPLLTSKLDTKAEPAKTGTAKPEPAKPEPVAPVPAAIPAPAPAPAPIPHPAPAHVEAPAAARPKIIRTGEMEFEVDSFETTVSTITKVVEEEGGYVSTTNSDKLPNGKVKGEIVLRVTPERLDTLVLKLRGIGDLKTQNIRAQDITKQYTDLESRLRAAQIMCDQILDIIKSGKAAVKDLLEAEKQLGVYREKVEQLTGEINYYANQISLSTLTLTLFERDIRTPALASEVETVTMTMVTEKVDDAAAKAKDAVAAAKGRIIASQQEQHDDGQSTATIKAQVPPDAAEAVIAKLKQIEGKLDHFDRQRSQTTSNGSAPVDARTADPVKVKREDVTIDLTLYNLAKLTPRRTTDLSLAATDVDEAKRALEEQVRTAGGRIVDSRTEYPRPDQKKGTISFDAPAEKADALIATLKGLGEMLQISTIENPSGQGVTESKRGFTAVIFDMAGVQPRRQTTLTLVTPTVDQTQSALADQVKQVGGRVIGRKIEHPTPEQSVGVLAFELPTAKADAFLLAIKPAGEMMQVNTADNNAAQNVTDSKRGFQFTILDLASVLPRRVTSLTLVTNTVDASEAALVEQVRQAGGRIINRKIEHPAPDQSIGNLTFEAPADKADALLAAMKQMGEALGTSTADNTGAQIVTDAKRGFGITLRSLTTFKAREAEEVTLASANVRDAFNDLRSLVHSQSGRVLTEHLNEEDSSNSVGQLEFEISREAAATIDRQMAKDGQVVTRLADRRPNAEDTIDSKVYVRLTISSAEQLSPRQSSVLGVEVSDVQRAMNDLAAAALAAGGRQVDNPAITQNAGQTTATVQYDVPLHQIQAMIDKVDAMGVRKSRQTSIDTHAPEGKLARARLTVTFETPATLSNPDDGLWAGIRRGLVTSLRVLSYSLTLIIIGLCVVVPFGVVLWGGWRGAKWMRKSGQPIVAN